METRSVSSLQFSWEQLTCLRQVKREMNEVRELSLRPSHQMEALPSPLSFRAKPRDLQFPLPSIEKPGHDLAGLKAYVRAPQPAAENQSPAGAEEASGASGRERLK